MAIRVDDISIRATWKGADISKGTRQVQRDMERMNRETAQFNNTLRSMGQLFGVALGVESIRRIASAGVEMAKLAAQARVTEQTFQNLATRGGVEVEASIERLREAAQGTISDFKLMQIAGQNMIAGLEIEQIATMLEFVRRRSLSFGKGFDESLRMISSGVQRASPLFLDDFQIFISLQDQMFKGLDNMAKRQVFTKEMVRQMTEQMKLLATETRLSLGHQRRFRRPPKSETFTLAVRSQDHATCHNRNPQSDRCVGIEHRSHALR